MSASTVVPGPEWVEPLSDFVAWLRSTDAPESTIYQRTYHLRRFGKATGLPPFEVGLDDLVAYLSAQHWGRSTKHAARSAFRNFYAWARLTRRVRSNPARHLPSVRPEFGRPRPASDDALQAGLSVADDRTRLMIRLAVGAGLRCCEVAKVHSADLVEDLDGWSLRVRGKGQKVRLVPLTRALALTLRSLPAGFVFPGRDDGHLSASYVSKLVSRALPAGVTAHMLRHRFASRAYVGAGRDIRAVQELLGHASVSTTQVYTQVPQGALRAGVEAAA